MKFNIIGRKITVNEKNSEYINKKIGKLDKFFKQEPEARIVIGTVKDKEYIEATIYAEGIIFRAEVTDNDVFTATDKVVDLIERQIRKNKTKLGRRIRESAFQKEEANKAEPVITEEETPIETDSPVRVKEFTMKPMSIEEAILEMNMLGHQFFVFEHDQTGLTSVVYQRKDGGYGLIKPKV